MLFEVSEKLYTLDHSGSRGAEVAEGLLLSLGAVEVLWGRGGRWYKVANWERFVDVLSCRVLDGYGGIRVLSKVPASFGATRLLHNSKEPRHAHLP